MKSRITIILILLSSNLFTQELLRFKVIDAVSKDALAYAHIFNLTKDNGTLTNLAGECAIDADLSDSIRISFLGYTTLDLTVEHTKYDIIELNPSSNLLSEVTIKPDKEDLYDIILQSKKLLEQNQNNTTAKAFLLVNSTEDSSPVEFTQLYYTAQIENGSIKELNFKNGSSYLRPNDQQGYFLNLNISKAFSLYDVVKNNKSLPVNPLQLSKRKMKKIYKLEKIALNDQYLKIKFTSQNSKTNYFSGFIWLDSKDFSMIKLELVGDNKNKLFKPIGRTQIDDFKYQISYNFRKVDQVNLISHITLDYDTNLWSIKDRTIVTEAILYITNYENYYHLPHFSFQSSISDYRAISLIPDSIIFNRLSKDNYFLLSKNQTENLEELKIYGEKFKSSIFGNKLFEHNYVNWSADRIFMKKTKKTIDRPDMRNVEARIDRYGFKSDNLKISTKLYLDLEESDNEILIETCTFLDTYESFNHLNDDVNLQAYVNIYFDLAEVYRLKFLSSIDPARMNRLEIVKRYNEINHELEKQQLTLQEDSFGGENILKLKSWNDYIFNEIEIDNFQLMNIVIE